MYFWLHYKKCRGKPKPKPKSEAKATAKSQAREYVRRSKQQLLEAYKCGTWKKRAKADYIGVQP